jgi:2-dehydro-3-deoxygalactonokinase
MIAVDWGTSGFRAYRLGTAGACVDRRQSGRGILSVPAGGFREALLAEVGNWIEAGERRVLLCGMAGARNGWMEAPYVAVPADAGALVAGCVRVPDGDLEVMIVPGVHGVDASGVPEVMRGEETEILGATIDPATVDAVVLPGTHTKWVRLQGASIVAFETYMTGDTFAAICSATILRGFPPAHEEASAAFEQGLERSGSQAALTHLAFGARTLFLQGALKAEDVSAYLSGLLIGYEVRHGLKGSRTVHLIGEQRLCMLYRRAVQWYGGAASIEEGDAAMRGLARIARGLGW